LLKTPAMSGSRVEATLREVTKLVPCWNFQTRHEPLNSFWVLPAVAFFVGLCLANAGVQAGTRSYVNMMVGTHAKGTLDDAAFHCSYPLLGFLVSFLTALIPFVWCAVVLGLRDLRLWCRTLLSGALLATFKGILAWSTVLPDAEGWDVCQAKLGDGLDYYRGQDWEVFSLLRVGSVCGDTLFSWAVCYRTLFAVSLCESSLQSSRSKSRGWLVSLLASLVSLDAVLTVANRYHYTADIIVGVLLALLVFGNPAIIVTAELWAKFPSADGPLLPDYSIEIEDIEDSGQFYAFPQGMCYMRETPRGALQ